MAYRLKITKQAAMQQSAHADYLMNTLQSDQALRHYVEEMRQLQGRIAQNPLQFPLSEDDFLAARGYRRAVFPSMQTLYFAGGCFWGVQKFFDQFRGVLETEAGYANGPEERDEKIYGSLTEEQKRFRDLPPGYQEVCGHIGFAEAVKVVYDESVLPTEKLLRYFFDVIDPTAVDRQGPDVGVQYRTGIYYEEEALRPAIEAVMEEVRQGLAEGRIPAGAGGSRELATELAPLANYYRAEDYHQDYLEKVPGGYCHIPRSKFLLQYAEDQEKKE